MDDDTPDMPNVWVTIDNELHRMRSSWAKLARAIEVSDQTIWNWKKRQTVALKKHPDIAAFLGWSIDQLLGLAPEPPRLRPIAAPAPEPVYTKRANDIAQMFDELKDDAVRKRAYATVVNILQMAKAGQRMPEPAAPPEIEPPTPAAPTPKTRAPAPAARKTPARGR